MTTSDKHYTLDRIFQWINNCDNKTSFLLATQGVVITLLAGSELSFIKRTFTYRFNFENITWLSTSMLFEGLFLYSFIMINIASLYFSYKALCAKLNHKKKSIPTSRSLTFFGSIANMECDEFKLAMKKSEVSSDISDELDSQIYINSIICNTKFKNYNKAISLAAIGFVVGGLYVILSYINL